MRVTLPPPKLCKRTLIGQFPFILIPVCATNEYMEIKQISDLLYFPHLALIYKYIIDFINQIYFETYPANNHL